MNKIACVTLDMEPDYGDPEKRIRLLEIPEYLDRYVSIVNKHGAKVTMFTVTNLFERFGERFAELAARIPLEFSVHSHTHDPRNACSLEEVRASREAFREFTGRKPLGYRAPIGRIDKEGLGRLLDHGFEYDASVYPSIRPGEFGYLNLHMPNAPFRVTREDGRSLVEFPFTAIEKIRIVFALSYGKLFGWGMYSLLLKVFGLPAQTLLLSHPYDFYFASIPTSTIRGLERAALARNSSRAFDLFDNMLGALAGRGYEFAFVIELHRSVKDAHLPVVAWEGWK